MVGFGGTALNQNRKKTQMKRMSKSAILEMPLVSFNIRPLTLWVTRPEREMEKQLKATCKCSSDPAVVESELAITRVKCMEEVNSQPKTVGDLIKKYKYRFVGRLRFPGMNWYRVRIGNKPINELKKKLIELGLTPDDWPALVPNHAYLIDHLSKGSIKNLPISEVLDKPTFETIAGYLDCQYEERHTKTVGDLIQINPLSINEDCRSQKRFFKRHERFFFALRQKLHRKGFSTRDGAFFKWNPVPNTYKKVCEILRAHKLPKDDVRRFANIVIAERWVM